MKNTLPLLAIMILVMAGCSKSDPNSNPKPGNGNNSTGLLTSSVMLGAGVPLTDTFSVTKYQYDSQNRLVLAATHVIKSGNIDSNVYYYNNDGDLAKVTYQTEWIGNKKLIGECNITYSNGVPASMNDKNNLTTTSFNYQVTDNKITGFSLAAASGSITSESGVFTYDGDNLKYFSLNEISNNIKITLKETYSYGAGKSIFFKTGSKWYLYGAGGGMSLSGQGELSSVTMEQSDSETNAITTTVDGYTYVNNADGYPTKVSATLNGALFFIEYYTYTPK